MTFNKWASQTFLTIREAVDYLSVKSGESHDLMNPNRVGAAHVLRSALDGSLPLVVDVATGTEDGEGRPIAAGLWDLPLEGAGRQQVEYDWRLSASLSQIDMDGIAGAVVEQDGVQHQLDPMVNLPSAFGAGCVLGVRREALDTLLEKTSPAKDLDKPLGTRERNTLLKVIIGLAKLADVELSHPSSNAVASRIESVTTDLGVRAPERTVVKKLKEAHDFLQEVGKPPK